MRVVARCAGSVALNDERRRVPFCHSVLQSSTVHMASEGRHKQSSLSQWIMEAMNVAHTARIL
jgi:hypothetical protein